MLYKIAQKIPENPESSLNSSALWKYNILIYGGDKRRYAGILIHSPLLPSLYFSGKSYPAKFFMRFRERVSLRDEMQGIVEEPLLHLVPKRFDFIGDIAIISIPSELGVYKNAIAEKLISVRGNTKAVLNKISKLEGDKRVAEFEILIGDSTETLHRENGYIYRLDVRKVFFNPRLYWERGRVGTKVSASEYVLVPFCGVGPFVLPAAGKGAKVLAIEKNPEACNFLEENIRRNKLEGRIKVLQVDVREIFGQNSSCSSSSCSSSSYSNSSHSSTFKISRFASLMEPGEFELPEAGFDRAIVPAPYGMDSALVEVLPFIRKGGYIHFYTFKTEAQIPEIIKTYESMGLELEFYRRCGNVAPGVSRWVFDLVKKQ